MPFFASSSLSVSAFLQSWSFLVSRRKVHSAPLLCCSRTSRSPAHTVLCYSSNGASGNRDKDSGSRVQTKDVRRGLKLGKIPVVEVSVKSCKTRDTCIVEGIACESGGSVLLDIMRDNLSAVDLYNTWGKVWQCGGSGRCGQCRVKVCQGHGLLSPKTPVERGHLKGMPWQGQCRLACQVQVGDGTNGGTVEVSLD